MVMVGEDLAATYARMQEHLREHPEQATSPAPGATPSASRSRAWWVGASVMVLLPFVWLAVLHYTLGHLVQQLQKAGGQTEVSVPKEVEALTAEVHQLQQQVDRLQTEVGQARTGEAATRKRRMGRPETPAEIVGKDGEPANVQDLDPDATIKNSLDEPEDDPDGEELGDEEVEDEEPTAGGQP